MMGKGKRDLMRPRAAFAGADPLAGTRAIRGARVYGVGQGDSIAIIDDDGQIVLQIDYGGKNRNPFSLKLATADGMMPVRGDQLLMLTHWDYDHWCSAQKGKLARNAIWLVPRQVTSPAAVEFANALLNLNCIPESQVNIARCFIAANGDELWWEKIGASQTSASREEDCNMTGVAFSLVRREGRGGQVILLPGDAPYARVPHYHQHLHDGLTLTGIVAFHHGSATHWTEATRAMLRDWPPTLPVMPVIFSCADPSGYPGIPTPANYMALFGHRAFQPQYTHAQPAQQPYCELRFA